MLRRAASASSSGRRLSVGGPVAARAAAPGAGAGGGGAGGGLPLPPPFGPQQQQQQRRQSQQHQEQQQQQHSTAPPVSSADASFDEGDPLNAPKPLPPRSGSNSAAARAPSLLHEEDLQRFFFAQQAEAAAAEAEGRAHHHLVRPASPVPPFERPASVAASAAAASSEQQHQQQRRQRRSTTSTSPVDNPPSPPLNHAYYVQATPIPRAFVAPPTAADGDALPADDNTNPSRNSNSNSNSSVAPPMHVTVFTEAEMDAVSAAAVASGLQPPAFDLACDVTTPRPALPLHLQRTTFTVVARRDYADVFLGVTGREQVNGLRGSQVPCYGWRCGAAEAAGVLGALPLAAAADGGGSIGGNGNGNNLGRLWRRGDAVELVLEPESPRRNASSGRQEEEEEGDADDADAEDDDNSNATMSLLLRVNGREVDRLHGIPAATLISSGKNSSSAPVWYVGLYASAPEGGAGGVTGGGNNAADLAAIMFESASSHSVAWGDFRVQRYT